MNIPVVGRIMTTPPQRFRIVIPRICLICCLTEQKGLDRYYQAKDVEMGRWSWVVQVAPCDHQGLS